MRCRLVMVVGASRQEHLPERKVQACGYFVAKIAMVPIFQLYFSLWIF